MEERPEALIITVGQKELKEKGYKNWLRHFLEAMNQEDWSYWYKLGNQPKITNLLYVYVCIGGRIRWRANFVMATGPSEMVFSDGRKSFAKAWLVCAGPAVKAPGLFPFKGFQGFRYSQIIF